MVMLTRTVLIKVSDTDEDTTASGRHQHIKNTPNRDTNTINNRISSGTQEADQLTNKTPTNYKQYTT